MPNNVQSIQDLLDAARGKDIDEASPEGKFLKKQKEIRIKEIERETQAIAAGSGISYINLFGYPISPDALKLIDFKTAQKDGVICFFYDGKKIRIGAVNPESEAARRILANLENKLYAKGGLFLISSHSFEYALKLYKNLPAVRKFKGGVEITEEDLQKYEKEIDDYKSLAKIINDVNVSDIVTLLLATAIKTKASDIHIEAEEKGIVIRLRIDGVLQDAATINKEKWKQIISRLKLVSGVKINVEGKPQDGRFSIYLSDEKIEVRCSFLPTAFGESVVMRLLRSKDIGVSFDKLGLNKIAYKKLEKEINKPNGLILTVGETGSGKTTTLYAILKKLNAPETKIITLEDPIEYELVGINQSQVDKSKNYTFANGLRSILRQDPDIVMIGEIRDLETAEIAIQASLTGHLVLSTLHTNTAAEVIPRLTDMGIKPYFLTPAINALIGQRLVRKLCPKCKAVDKLKKDQLELVKKILAIISPKSGMEIPTVIPTIFKAGPGCDYCQGIGYKGRIGIYEILTMTDSIKQLVSDNAPAFKIQEKAIEDGMVTMLQDGVLKALDGTTSLEEVYRVIGKFEYVDTLYDIVVSQTIGRGVKIGKKEMQKAAELSANISRAAKELKEVPPNQIFEVVAALAVQVEAGDIHVDPTEEGVKVRFRIDGIMHDIVDLPKDYYLQLLSQIKIFAGFPTNVKKATWDGRFGIFIEDKKIDCRISIISGGYGQTVVIRILSQQAAALNFTDLGLRPYSQAPLDAAMRRTKGIIINTGPTGSGKTTTLYSILNKLNTPDVKIITLEDPIEYHLEGIMQTQIDVDEGYTFAVALRSLLRQNPNIIMIGEIRDEETAKVSIESAMTGHLVLSTIHANSAAGAIARFKGLGIDAQMLANSMNAAMAQRLARKVCPFCKVEYDPPIEAVKEAEEILMSISPKANIEIPKNFKFYKGKGCPKCSGLGYKGRVGLYEIFEMLPDIQKLILNPDSTEYDITRLAVEMGAVTVIQDGVLKALAGETTIEEVFRVAK